MRGSSWRGSGAVMRTERATPAQTGARAARRGRQGTAEIGPVQGCGSVWLTYCFFLCLECSFTVIHWAATGLECRLQIFAGTMQ
jgi:hypothetical protein